MTDIKWTRVGRDIMAETGNLYIYVETWSGRFHLRVMRKSGIQVLNLKRKRQRECKELDARLMEILEDED